MKIDEAIDKLEVRLRELKREYELFFMGEARRAPLTERERIRQAIIKLQSVSITNTRLRFKVQTLANHFTSFCGLWDRTMSQMEAGTYRPDRFKADLRVGRVNDIQKSAPENAKDADRSDDKPAAAAENGLKGLYGQFLDARRSTGEKTEISYDAFKKSVEKQRPQLEAKFGKDMKFKVVVEDGKAKLKGVGK